MKLVELQREGIGATLILFCVLWMFWSLWPFLVTNSSDGPGATSGPWSMCCGHPNNNNNSNNNYSYHNSMRKLVHRTETGTHCQHWGPRLISPFTSCVLEIWISIQNVIKDDNYAGEIMNKGALNIAFSRLNLHTQLIFVLATILAFQIINRTLKSLKILLWFKWVWQCQCLKHQKQIILTRETGKPIQVFMNIPDGCCLDVSARGWCVIFPIFGAVQFHPGLLSFAALLCWIAKQGKKCGAKIWFNNQPFNPLTLPSRNLAYHLSTFCSVRTELMWTPSSLWLVMVRDFWLPRSSTFNITKITATL